MHMVCGCSKVLRMFQSKKQLGNQWLCRNRRRKKQDKRSKLPFVGKPQKRWVLINQRGECGFGKHWFPELGLPFSNRGTQNLCYGLRHHRETIGKPMVVKPFKRIVKSAKPQSAVCVTASQSSGFVPESNVLGFDQPKRRVRIRKTLVSTQSGNIGFLAIRNYLLWANHRNSSTESTYIPLLGKSPRKCAFKTQAYRCRDFPFFGKQLGNQWLCRNRRRKKQDKLASFSEGLPLRGRW